MSKFNPQAGAKSNKMITCEFPVGFFYPDSFPTKRIMSVYGDDDIRY